VSHFFFFICSVCGDLFSLVLTMEFSYKKVIREKIVIINLGSFLGQVQECIVHFFYLFGCREKLRVLKMNRMKEKINRKSYGFSFIHLLLVYIHIIYSCLTHSRSPYWTKRAIVLNSKNKSKIWAVVF
jgi:hypothetical protein